MRWMADADGRSSLSDNSHIYKLYCKRAQTAQTHTESHANTHQAH